MLKRYSCLHLKRAWRYKVRAAKRRKKVVQRDLVGDVYPSESQRDLLVLRAEQVVSADAEVK